MSIKKEKSVIVLIGFGDLSLLRKEYHKQFPDFSILSAKTLNEINLNEFSNVYIQPVYLLAGYEYDRLCYNAKELSLKVSVANPLLSDGEGFRKTAQLLSDKYFGKTVFFIGHGTSHPACIDAYFLMEQALQAVGLTRFEVAVLEGEPNVFDAVKKLNNNDVNRITLVPLMISNGKHTQCDIFGNNPESVLSMLKSKGIVVDKSQKSLLDFPNIRQMFVDNTKAILSNHKHSL